MKKTRDVLILLFAAFITLLFFSPVTSPLMHGEYYKLDSSIFMVIGRGWADGLLPYRDLWDSKGPYVFFIDALGFIMGGKNAIFVLQVINLWITLIFCYKALKIFLPDIKAIILTAFAVPFTIPLSFYYGNTQSEWCLPWIMAAVYCIYKYIDSGEEKHPVKYGFAYGLSIGICVMSRPSNAVCVAMSVFAIFIYLICKKEFRNVILNCLAGLGGIIVIILPFVIYFWTKGLLYDMWYATIIYNSGEYLDFTVSKYHLLGNNAVSALRVNFAMFAVLLSMFLCFSKKKYKTIYILFIPQITAFIILTFKTAGLKHYYSIFLPVFIIALAFLFQKGTHKIIYALAGFILLVCVLDSASVLTFTFEKDENEEQYYECYKTAVERIPEGSSFLSVNDYDCSTYLRFNLTPACRDFALQNWRIEISPSDAEKITEDFREKMPDYVLFSEANSNVQVELDIKFETSNYYEILNNFYEIESETAVTDKFGKNCRLILLRRDKK